MATDTSYDSSLTHQIPIDSLPQTLVYNGDGTLNYVEATSGTDTWRQTYTYTAGKLTGISGWVKQ